MVQCVRSGVIHADLADSAIGPINHSWWLTNSNHILRLWISCHGFTGEVFENLKVLVEFIVGQYYPMWFYIKVKHSWIDGPTRILSQIKCYREQSSRVQNIVWKYMQSSSWFAHPEAILQSLLANDNEEQRQFAVNKIVQIRTQLKLIDRGDKGVRS